MDLYRALQDLYAEKEKLERAIESLEQLQRVKPGALPEQSSTKRRGRKSMSSEERAEVSERMKRYWEAQRVVKREQKQAGAKAGTKARGGGQE
jgi:hypothetical protein